ncbi:ISLre2 family transposase, partial [Nostoc sp. UIC 10607]
MEKYICATLDLSKSLSNFSLEMTKCLELTNITEWNGKILKEREEKIREIALILAGQCIAILLYNLSQSQSANQIAMIQTKSWWDNTMQKHGYRKRQILTVGNVLFTLKLPYMVIKKSTKTTNKMSLQGFYPMLKWLGMSEGLTPLVWSTVAQYGAITSSFEAACTTLTGWGIDLSLKRIERLTYKFGQTGINLRQCKILNRQIGILPEGNILKDQRVVIAVDGGRSRIRINKKGRKNSKTKRHGFIGKWVEPKLFTIYVVDEQGKKINSSEIPITNDGTYEGYKALLEILEADLVDLGISQAKQV